MRTINDKMKKLSTARRRKVEDRAAELIAEEMSLRDLWRAQHSEPAFLAAFKQQY